MSADRSHRIVDNPALESGFLRSHGYTVLPTRSDNTTTTLTTTLDGSSESTLSDGQRGDRSEGSVEAPPGRPPWKVISLRLFTIFLSPLLVFMVILGSVSASLCPDDCLLHAFTIGAGLTGLLSYIFLSYVWMQRDESLTTFLFRIFGVELVAASFLSNVAPLMHVSKVVGDDRMVCRMSLGFSPLLLFGHMAILFLLLWKSIDHRVPCSRYVADASGSGRGCGWNCCG